MSSGPWHDLRLRVISALVLAPVGIACLAFGGAAWFLLMVLCTVVMALEWTTMCGLTPARPAWWLVLAAPLTALVLAAMEHTPAALAVMLVAAILVLVLARGSGRAHEAAFGVPYIGLPALALLWLRLDATVGAANLLFLLFVVWANDIGAYLAGRLIGGKKLAPAISPGKTWSGAVGGALAGMAVAALMAYAWSGAGAGRAALVALLLGAVGQAGDLLESAAKRRLGVKDSGRLIPGHGGLLDRLDAVLAVALVAWLIAWPLGRGVVLWQ